jgi:hypothetical protein
MKSPKKNPCSECPFRRKSLPGYLGRATPESFLAAAHSGAVSMPCHSEVDYERDDWEEQQTRVHQCTGHAIYLSNTCKQSESPDVRKLPANRELVFAGPPDFLEHHGGDPIVFMQAMLPGIKYSKAEQKRTRENFKRAVERIKAAS